MDELSYAVYGLLWAKCWVDFSPHSVKPIAAFEYAIYSCI